VAANSGLGNNLKDGGGGASTFAGKGQ